MVNKQEETEPGALLGKGSGENLDSRSDRHALSSQPHHASVHNPEGAI